MLPPAPPRWDTLLIYSLPCIPLALLRLAEPFRPVQILFQHIRITPAALAPWTLPAPLAWLPRLAQWAVLSQSTTHMSPWLSAQIYGAWWPCVLLRTLVGFILTRSVGWAAPSFFSSRSGYEGSAGIGPMLIALEVDPFTGNTSDTTRFVWIAALASFEQTPWTYAAASFIAMLITLTGQVCSGQYRAVDVEAIPMRAGDNNDDDNQPAKPSQTAKAIAAIRRCAIRLAVCATVGIVLYATRPSLPTLPASPTPIAHLIILTSPRPRDVAQGFNSTLARTIASYTPFTTSLSVVTGFKQIDHPAFATAKAANPSLRFVAEIGLPGLTEGHHRDLAGLLHWAAQQGSQWTMVIEDDFPLCDAWGWRGLQGVLATLELGRRQSPFAHAGWVGTGGSGLILHQSLLSANEALLSEQAKLPANERVPADLLVQMCSFGEDDRCNNAGGVVISDRMIMHHTGSDDSSLGHDVGAGKYACGWRQPAHGREFVTSVIEV